MKYLAVLVFGLAVWVLLEEFILKDLRSNGMNSFWDNWRDLGRRMHMMIGIIAVLIIIVFFVRIVLYATRSWWTNQSKRLLWQIRVFGFLKNTKSLSVATILPGAFIKKKNCTQSPLKSRQDTIPSHHFKRARHGDTAPTAEGGEA